jgi:hypothetical protein
MAGRDNIARQRNIAQRAVSCLRLVVALGLSVAAVFLVSDTHSFIKRAVLVHGKVVALERVPIPNKVVSLFYPIVTFTGKRGDQRTIGTSAMIMPSIGKPSTCSMTRPILPTHASPRFGISTFYLSRLA